MGLTYFGTISTRGAREATGTLEALSTRRTTFTWETSLTLWEETPGRNQAKVVGKMGWGEARVPQEPKAGCTAGRHGQN